MQQSRESKAAHMGIQMRIDNTCEKGFASPRSSHQPPQCAVRSCCNGYHGADRRAWEHQRWEYVSHSTKVGVLLPCILQGVIQNQGQHSGPCLEAPGVCFLQLFFWLIDFFLPNEEFWCRWAFDEPWVICVTAPLCLKLRHLIIPRGNFPSRGWSAKRWEAF